MLLSALVLNPDPFEGGYRFTPPGGGTFTPPGGGAFISPARRGGIDFSSPLGSYNFQEIVSNVISGLIKLATPIAAIMVIWGAFLFITSAGNENKLRDARKTILWAAVGYGVLWIAWGVVFVVEELLGVK